MPEKERTPVPDLIRATLLKGIGSFYFCDDGKEVCRARARGILKKDGNALTAGDEVLLCPAENEEDDARIESILPRKNIFQRPPVANVDLFLVLIPCAEPDPHPYITDKLLVMAEKAGTKPLICLTKGDLAPRRKAERIRRIYAPLYPFFEVNGITGEGCAALRAFLQMAGGRVALAGPSAAGKSSLVNLLAPGAGAVTGAVSRKTDRGRHTTRHVELFVQERFSIFDTPGFTSFDLLGVQEEELSAFFPEIREAASHCRFDDCRHGKEPGCAVHVGIRSGTIARSRYISYRKALQEIQAKRSY